MRVFAAAMLLASIFCFSGAIAQERLLMGRVVDDNGLGVKGAIVKVSSKTIALEARSDRDGVFYTKLLPSDSYRLGVVAGGRYLKGKKIYFAASERMNYILHIHDGKLEIEESDKDVVADARVGVLAE